MSDSSQKDAAQNRLLVATAVLSFIYYAGAKFSGLSVAGAVVTFSNEGAVLEFAWVIWFYYYLRCYQYYKKMGAATFQQSLNRSYITSFGHRLVNLDRHEFELLPDDDAVKSSTLRLRWGLSAHEIQRRSMSRKKVVEYANRVRKRRSFINLLRPRVSVRLLSRLVASLFNLRLSRFRAVIYPPSDRNSLSGQSKYEVNLPFWMPLLVVVVYARTAIARPEFIENQGPLVLGLVPVWYVILRSWSAASFFFFLR